MDKIIKYVPLSIFVIFAMKSLVYGAFVLDAPILLILALLAAFYEYQFQNKSVQVMHKRCDEIDKHLSTIYKNQSELKSEIATAKLGVNVRNLHTQNPIQGGFFNSGIGT